MMHHSINTVLSWFVFSIHTLPNVNSARDLNGLPRTLPTRLRVGSFGFSRPSVSRARLADETQLKPVMLPQPPMPPESVWGKAGAGWKAGWIGPTLIGPFS
jgi:hypothetical protein